MARPEMRLVVVSMGSELGLGLVEDLDDVIGVIGVLGYTTKGNAKTLAVATTRSASC